MIRYEQFCQIRALGAQGLNANQIAGQLGLSQPTVARWLQTAKWVPRRPGPSSSILDPYKDHIRRWLGRHPYTAVQIGRMLREQCGYRGGHTILKDFIRSIRPPKVGAFLVLHFEPAEAAQIDWGQCGLIPVGPDGRDKRRLYFFVMVLCHSRLLYVEFTPGAAMEHFLSCHQNALQYFGGTPRRVIHDNLKTAVIDHRRGQGPRFHARYLDFAAHYGFEPVACNPRAGHEKGRVERGVGYVKINFLAGAGFTHFGQFNPAARHWMEQTANLRVHGTTRQVPRIHFEEERSLLRPLPPAPYDASVIKITRANSCCRVQFDSNRYSVPFRHAGRRVEIKVAADRLVFYGASAPAELIATHPRCYGRHRDIEDPEHVAALLGQRRKAREQRLLVEFLALGPQAEEFYKHLEQRRLNPRSHAIQILALRGQYGAEAVARALADACELHAFSADYIANILEQRRRFQGGHLPGPLHLTRSADLLELEMPRPDISVYERAAGAGPPEPTL